MSKQSSVRRQQASVEEPSVDSFIPHKYLSWGNITIYEFSNILGDNPAVSGGSPLTISWKYDSKNVVDVNLYEFFRQSNPRRRKKELVIKAGERDSFLLSKGYSLDQLIAATEEGRKIRDSRRSNMKDGNNPWMKLLVLGEGTANGIIGLGGATAKSIAVIGEGTAKGIIGLGEGTAKGIKVVGGGTAKGIMAVGEGTAKGIMAVGEGTAKGIKAVGEGTAKGFKVVGEGTAKGFSTIVNQSVVIGEGTAKSLRRASTALVSPIVKFSSSSSAIQS